MLETININRYMLPGQLRPFAAKNLGGNQLKGDHDFLHVLATLNNDTKNFR